MPINRRSQARRAHLEQKARKNYAGHFDKTFGDTPTMDKELKAEAKKRGNSKKR